MRAETAVLLKTFVFSLVIFSIVIYAFVQHEASQTPEKIMKARLESFGYPESGYIAAGGTILYADGRMAIMNSGGVTIYPVNIYHAYSSAVSVIQPYNSKLQKYNYTITVNYRNFTQIESNSTYYFVFPVEMRDHHIILGYVFVDREKGSAFLKGLLG